MTVYGFGHLNMLYDNKRSDNRFWQRNARSDHQGQIFDIHGKPFARAFNYIFYPHAVGIDYKPNFHLKRNLKLRQ